MKFTIVFSMFVFLAGSLICQQENKTTITKIKDAYGNEVELTSLGNTRIVLKDGSIKKNCVLKEIKMNGVVYMKDQVLHDMQIDRIKRIELGDGWNAIYFDDKNLPSVSGIKN